MEATVFQGEDTQEAGMSHFLWTMRRESSSSTRSALEGGAAGGGVEAAAHEDELGLAPGRDRGQDPLKNVEKIGVALAGAEGDVEVVAEAFPVAEVPGGPGTRVERRLMSRKIEHVAPRIKSELGAVAVMEVPVDDGDASQAVGPDGRR